jgi:opacity protein-like surface antigen
MSFPCWISPMRRVSVLAAAAFLAASLASAQSDVAANQNQSTAPTTAPISAPALSPGESSSLQVASSMAPGDPFAEPASPGAGGASGAAAGQDYGGGHGLWSKAKSDFAFEAGGGFNAPRSNSVTYGGNFTVGGGLNLNKRLAVLAEFQFIDDKLPGSLIAEADAQGGHAHIWSLTLDPVLDLFPKAKNDVYVTGGGGFYRKVSSFTDPEEEEICYYFCEVGTEDVVIAHFSSNQGGWNVGAGFQHRLGGMYDDSKTKLFAEVRYLDVMSPAVNGLSPNGSGLITTVQADTKMIPITVGVRF